uniref:Alfy-like armadillo-like repeat domain-containing protein n=1 Tax=Globisporangium ultimum (strain ATCC 200006 / CBS 805.95 / DAOM BR144) TaxID=431595 RepID=K3W508_GLOUD
MVLLDVLKQMLQGKNFVWGPWRSCQGHETLISILSSLGSMGEDTDGKQFQLMDLILATLSDILDPVNGDEGNRQYFKTEVGYLAIASCLVNSGVLKTDKLASVLNRIFELITGVSSPRNKIRNADAVHTLFCLIPRVETETAEASLDRLMLKLTSNDEIAFSRKKQTATLEHSDGLQIQR